MPDAYGNFKPFASTRKTAEAWERIFGPKPAPADEVIPRKPEPPEAD